MKKKIHYETPVVEVLNARVEKGFAGSGTNNDPEPEQGTQPLADGGTYYWN